jgi:hypothetical protein
MPAHRLSSFQADDALAQIVAPRLFVIERSREFDFLIYGSSVAEPRDVMAKANAYAATPEDEAVAARAARLAARVEEIMQAARKGAEVAHHERGRIARLKPMRS